MPKGCSRASRAPLSLKPMRSGSPSQSAGWPSSSLVLSPPFLPSKSSGSPAKPCVIRVEFHPEADAELVAAARYYEAEAENLGTDFLAAVESSCARLRQFPEIGHPFGGRLRRLLVPRFPYAVIYEVQGQQILIVAVANLYRRPGYWRARL